MPIPTLPTPPSRDDPANFSSRADAFLSLLPSFATEANILQADVTTKQSVASSAATTAQASATAAQAAQTAAENASNATIWVSGTSYAIGVVRFSPSNFLSYRRKTTGAGTTDPAADGTNWEPISLLPRPTYVANSGLLTTTGTFINYTYGLQSGLNFNTATGVYTYPATGFYLVSALCEMTRTTSTTGNTSVSISVGAGLVASATEYSAGVVGEIHTLALSGAAYATAGQTSSVSVIQIAGVQIRVTHLSFVRVA